jgi:hypothetical protein
MHPLRLSLCIISQHEYFDVLTNPEYIKMGSYPARSHLKTNDELSALPQDLVSSDLHDAIDSQSGNEGGHEALLGGKHRPSNPPPVVIVASPRFHPHFAV